MEFIKAFIADINAQIFVGFLALNLVFGLMASKGVSTMQAYSIGNKDFSTATIISTIVATWVSGEFFFTIVAETYTQGLSFIAIVMLSDFLGLFLIGSVFAVRMQKFIDKLSIAEAMGDLYGKEVRIITAISGFIAISGIISIQLKISGLLFEYALGVPLIYGIVISGIIITIYSSLGGIKSVTLTDVVQFIAFGTIIPVIAYFLIKGISSDKSVVQTITENPLFDTTKIFSFSNPNLYYLISIFLWSAIPSFNPAIFQRIAMAKDTNQVRQSFIIASMFCLLLAAIVSWIGVLILTIYPNLKGEEVLKVMISEHNWITGFRGIILAGVMAMVMSTVDSYINSSSILLVHDLRQSLGKPLLANELKTTRICSAIIGIISILFAIRSGSFLDLFIWASMFYMPVVTVPFIMTIFGFRSSSKSVISGMIAGFSVAMLWEILLKEQMQNIGGLIPGMLANLSVLFFTHYIFNQPGGWKIKEKSSSDEKIITTYSYQNKIDDIWHCLQQNLPKRNGIIALFGLFILISNILSASMLSKAIYINHALIFDPIYIITLLIATLLINYPLWPKNCRRANYMVYIWHSIIFIVPICFSFLTVIMTNFSEVQLMVFMANIIVISALLNWKTILCLVVPGMILVSILFKHQIQVEQLPEIFSTEFKVAYLLILVGSIIIAFLKPRQEQFETAESQVEGLQAEVGNLGKVVGSLNGKITELHNVANFYSVRAEDQAKEIERLGSTAQKILNNVNHELRLPIGNVINFAQMLAEGLEKYDKEHLKMLLDEVLQNSNRLSSMILNMLDLAMLDAKKVELKKQTINLSNLVRDRIKECCKIYLQEKPIDFELFIEPEIFSFVDANYIRQTIDNLVINAINYSEDGKIKIILRITDEKMIEIVIEDEGVGIPKHELYDIFTPFKMSSKTESSAQGRGVGLALCKTAIEAHGGTIKVESDGIKGTRFTVILPHASL
ncbi:MAG: hypothetical protein H6909_00830 [Rickettsiaceae bacterium]|nr:hypothetical protein [Rickettsiaceae bacterium]